MNNKADKAVSLGARERVRTAGQNGGMISNENGGGFKTYVVALQNNANPPGPRRFQSKNEREPAKFITSFASGTEERNDRYKNSNNSNTRERSKQPQRYAVKK